LHHFVVPRHESARGSLERRLQSVLAQIGMAQRHQFDADDVAAITALDPAALFQAIQQQIEGAAGELAGFGQLGCLDRRVAAGQHLQDVVRAADGGDVVYGCHALFVQHIGHKFMMLDMIMEVS
jgi:ketosteroid isomerase-like protein